MSVASHLIFPFLCQLLQPLIKERTSLNGVQNGHTVCAHGQVPQPPKPTLSVWTWYVTM